MPRLVTPMPSASQVQTQLSLPPHSCFQFFGLDYLLDDDHTPWLLEVNATPSMKVRMAAAGPVALGLQRHCADGS